MPSRMGDRFQVGDFVAVHGGSWIGNFGSIERTTMWSYVLHLDYELTRPCNQTKVFVYEVTVRKWSVRAQTEDEQRENGLLKRDTLMSIQKNQLTMRASMNSSSTFAIAFDKASEKFKTKCLSDYGLLLDGN
jgi:ribosomal protein L24